MTQDNYLKDPLLIQKSVLDRYQDNLDGDLEVVDTNNSFMFMVETMSSMTAEVARELDERLLATYPRRATNIADLFNHISDYVHVGFYSYPAPMVLNFTLSKDYIKANAVDVPGANYKKMLIPKDSVFNVGTYKFGIHYPVELRVSPNVGNVTVVYDTTETNPLESLKSNLIQSSEFNSGGVTVISFDLPVHQFKTDFYDESVAPSIGFKRSFTFDDKFYSIRVSELVKRNDLSGENIWDEKPLTLTMSKEVYDVDTPTAIFRVDESSKTVDVEIPMIYFTGGKVGNRFKISIMTTMGELDVNISNLDLKDISATFNVPTNRPDLSKYTSVLEKITTIIIKPVTGRVIGGSNGMSFEEMKEAVVNSSVDAVPVTPTQLDYFFKKNGYTGILVKDGVTDRIYYAYKRIADAGEPIGITNTSLTLVPSDLPASAKVMAHSNDHIVLLPGAVLSTSLKAGTSKVVSDSMLDTIKGYSKDALIDYLEDNQLTVNPFHLCLTTEGVYHKARTYDLFDTEVSNINFIRENLSISAQMSLVVAEITHLSEGSGGYRLRMGFSKTAELSNVPAEDIMVEVSGLSTFSTQFKWEATYFGEYGGLAIYDVMIGTDYNLDEQVIDIKDVTFANGQTIDTRINLTGTFDIVTTVKGTNFPMGSADTAIDRILVIPYSDHLAISHQTINYQLGVPIDDVIDNNLYLGWENETYLKYDADVPLLYEAPVYETNEDGTLKVIISGEDVVLNKLHDIGDPVLDEESNPRYLHYAGDPMRDGAGNPIVDKNRSISYTVQLASIDYKNFLTIENFFTSYSEIIRSNFDTIRTMSNNVLEETQVFLREMDTLTEATFRLNDATTIRLSPDLSFQLRLFVPVSVNNDDALIASIKTQIKSIIEEHVVSRVISLSAITKEILDQLGDHITAVDGLSISDNPDIQTLTLEDSKRSAKLASTLRVSDSDDFYLEPAISYNIQILD